MSTWAVVAAKGAAATSVGSGIGLAPSALDGFAVGALLTGLCFLVIVAPHLIRRSRLSARQRMWTASSRHARVRPAHYAAPDFATPELATPDFGTPDVGTPDFVAPEDTYFLAAPSDLDVAATETAQAQDAPATYSDPSPEVFIPAAGEDFGGHAGADPYADPYADVFGASAENEIDLSGIDEAPQDSGRGYHSKHRMTGSETGERRPEARRGPPRHAAPSARLGARMSSRLAVFSIAAARG